MGVSERGESGLASGGMFPRLQARFGLREDPLAMESPFFPEAQRQHALESLRHLCGFGDIALLLTGARGAGKTRLLAELVRSEGGRLDFHFLDVAALTSAQAVARVLLATAHQHLKPGSSPRDAVYGFFRWSESATRKGRRLVLLIDNADQGAPELMRLILSAFQAADSSTAAVPVFTGGDQLLEVLGLAGSVEPAGVHQIRLRPLNREEIFAYLEPRVQRAGGKPSELLGRAMIQRIHDLSQGSLGRLKRVAPAVWLGLAQDSSSKVPAGTLQKLRWPVLVLLLLATSWWLVSRQYDAIVDEGEVEAVSPPPERKSVTLGPGHPRLETQLDSSGASDPRSTVDALSSTEPSVSLQPEPEPEPAPMVVDQVERQQTLPPVVTAPVSPVETTLAEPEVADASVEFSPAKPEWFVPLASVRAKAGYTAQFIAGYEESTAVGFIEAHPAAEALRYTRTKRGERDWFVVFFGEYSGRAETREALKPYSESLGDTQPWIRKLADI